MDVSAKFIETEITTDHEFINLALTRGYPIKSRKDGGVIDTLIALTSNDVEKDSLSQRYGLNQFPHLV